MRGLIVAQRLLAATAFTVVVATGCLSATPGPISDAEVEKLLARLRKPASESFAWQAIGRGRVLLAQGSVWLLADDEGRFSLKLDAPVHFAEVHNGRTTFKLFPWGSVLDLDAREEEMSLVPMWVVTGYWLSPNAPVAISAGAVGHHDDVVALEVRHRDGQLPFEVLVDTVRCVPISVRTAVGVPALVLEMRDHRIVNGRPVPASMRWLQHGKAIAEMVFDPPSEIPPGSDAWSRPEAVTRVSYDRSASAQIENVNDGRGYLFVRPVINGRQLGWFLFDTGAPATILGIDAVEQLGLDEAAKTESSGVGGIEDIRIHAIDSIQVGPVRVGPAFLASMDVLRLGWKNLPIEGILGCDVIGRAVVEYDVRSGTIGFHDPAIYELPSNASWQRILLNGGKPIVRLRFEDHEGEFLVDTAAGGTFSISKPLVDRLGLLKDRKAQNSNVRGIGGSVGMRRGTVRWLDFGGTRYENVTTIFATSDQGSYAQPFPDGIVGIQLIDDFRIVFDLTNKRMAFLD